MDAYPGHYGIIIHQLFGNSDQLRENREDNSSYETFTMNLLSTKLISYEKRDHNYYVCIHTLIVMHTLHRT